MAAIQRCNLCGEPIGVYERAVFVLELPHETTSAANPELARTATEHYHRDCFTARSTLAETSTDPN